MDTKTAAAAPEGLRTIIIGAGMAGLLAAIKLKERGETDFTIYEKGDSVGGTWRENTYPGLSCDTPAHAYSYSFALNPEWSAVYAPGPEIKAYFEGIARRFDLYPSIRFNSEIESAECPSRMALARSRDPARVKATPASGCAALNAASASRTNPYLRAV